jgi:hypothetical protein
VRFFGELAQARLPQGFFLLDEAAGHGELAFAGRVRAADHEHVLLAAQHGIDGDEHGRVGRAGPGGAVVAQHAPFVLQRGVFRFLRKITQKGKRGGRYVLFPWEQCGIDGS